MGDIQPEDNVFKFKKNFINPDSIRSIHANEATINSTQTEFFLTFYRLEPPIVLGDEDRKKLQDLGEIDVIAVSKIVMTPTFVRAFHKVLTEQINTYNETNETIKSAGTNENGNV